MKKILFFAIVLNLVPHFWASTPELKELMRQSQPFDRGASLSASVDALITSKKGNETVMQYNMYTNRSQGKINVMIAFFAPNSFDGTRILTSVPEEGGVPGVAIKFKSFFATMKIPFVSSDMSFFGMDFNTGDMNPRNSSFDHYTLLETTVLSDGSAGCIVEAYPLENKLYHRIIHHVDIEKKIIVRSEMYNKKNELVKLLEVLECVAIQDIWSATKVRMQDLKSGSNTVLTYKSLVYHGDYTAYVNEAFLKTGEPQ
ncbi:MAG: outer membrane lipoprotein-sorting protein [Treponema sp.]|nr:outer membrane lipoprotein-sorting protein [Treponema sp.]